MVLASLNVQLRGGRPSNVLLVRRKGLLHGSSRSAVLVDNLDATADVELGLHHGVQLAPDGLEVFGVTNALDEVVWLALDEIRQLANDSESRAQPRYGEQSRLGLRGGGLTYLDLHHTCRLVR